MLMPFMIPLYLGMTFDARYSRPGVDIFDAQYIDNPFVHEVMNTQSNYSVISNVTQMTKQLDISGDIALKIKSGMISVAGKGSYLKNEKDFDKSVLVLTYMKYTSVVKSLSGYAKPRKNWAEQFSSEVLGTHYVNSIHYGAEMIASAKFVAHHSEDLEDIKGQIEAALGSGGSGIDLVAKGKLAKLEKKLKGKANLEISYYGTVPIRSIPNTIEGLKELIETFDEQVRKTENVNGIPTYVDILPLIAITEAEDNDEFKFIKNKVLMERLKAFEENFDELRSQREKLFKWARTLPFDLNDEYRHKIGELLMIMNKALHKYYKALWSMDLTKDPEQLDEAFSAYDYDNSGWLHLYKRRVHKLITEVERKVNLDIYATGAIFTRWGNNTCPGKKTVQIYNGFTFSSSEDNGIGGTAQYDCSPSRMEQKYELNRNMKFRSDIAATRYGKILPVDNPFQGPFGHHIEGRGVPCAKCYSPDSNNIAMFPASQECPLLWNFLYKGYLMSARYEDDSKTQYICVDDIPSEPYPIDFHGNFPNILALTSVQSGVPIPADKYTEGAIIKCVVCAFKSNHAL